MNEKGMQRKGSNFSSIFGDRKASNGSRDMIETIRSASKLEPSLATRHELKKNINDVLLEMEYHISELTR